MPELPLLTDFFADFDGEMKLSRTLGDWRRRRASIACGLALNRKRFIVELLEESSGKT